ncbi:MAG: hypothetical protein ACON5A_03415 [Candidatus Comchoanobacterales bacterium]
MKFTTKLAAAAAALTLTTSAFAFDAKLIKLEDLPPIAELIQVKQMGIDMFFEECYLPVAGGDGSDIIFRNQTMDLPQAATGNPSGFSYLKNIKCIDTKALDGVNGNDITSVATQANTAPCLEFEYNANVGSLSGVKLYLCPLGVDAKMIITDTSGDSSLEVSQHAGVVLDMCIAAASGGISDGVFFELGTTDSDAQLAGTTHRNIEGVLGFSFCRAH